MSVFSELETNILIYGDLLVKSEHFDESCCSYLEQYSKLQKALDFSLKGKTAFI